MATGRYHNRLRLLASCRNAVYGKKAVRLTFSDNGLAPKTIAAMAYQTDTWAATFICWEECPSAHQTSG